MNISSSTHNCKRYKKTWQKHVGIGIYISNSSDKILRLEKVQLSLNGFAWGHTFIVEI